MDETQSPWVDATAWKTRWETINGLRGGGQGDAFRARRLSDGAIGFLKIIKSRKDPERRARFFREAVAYSSFGVEGIPRLIESNAIHYADETVIPYIVTTFVEGPTLRAWRDGQSTVSVETAVALTQRLLDILDACHDEGCVHRDVKPDNIILEDGDPARPWLLDFGISYHDLAEIDFGTEDGQEVGNRFLRLPELSAGSRSKQDPRSDICFAAGILYYLLTSDHPDVLEDSEGRLPHQRSVALAKLQHAAPHHLTRLLALFDEAFATRTANRFTTVRAMQERMNRMMQDQPVTGSTEADLTALRELLDTGVNRRLSETMIKLHDGLRRVQQIFNEVRDTIGGSLVLSQTANDVTGERGTNTLFWSRQSTNDRFLSVFYEVIPTGEELVIRMSGETVYRTDLTQPDYGEHFHDAIRGWVVARLRAALSDPHALAPEADCFRDITPLGSLEAAAAEAARRHLPILAFVYDPALPGRGKLRWALGYFLENRRTRDTMNGAFVTALVPLSAIVAISDILDGQSMETPHWVVLDRYLHPIEHDVVYANPQEAERIVGQLAARHATRPEDPA